MREFKFRSWDNGQMHRVSFNNLLCNYNHPNGKIIVREERLPEGKRYITDLMQYTGLKDCEENEIYEGDILQKNKHILVVKFGKYAPCDMDPNKGGHQGFYADAVDNPHDMIRRDIHAWIKNGACVVGNIHENPEIIGGKNQ